MDAGEGGAEVVGLVLAAGASERLGRPKALVEFGGVPALRIVLDALAAAGIVRGVTIVGPDGDACEAAVDPAPFAWVRHEGWAAGRTGSIGAGWRALPEGADVLLWPVDRPLASIATAAALVAGRAEAPGAVIVPEHGGRRGHPILLPAALRDTVLAAAPDASLRGVLRESATPRSVVPVDDPGLAFNLDDEVSVLVARAWWEGARRGGSGA